MYKFYSVGIFHPDDFFNKEITAHIQNCLFYIKHAKYNNTPIFYDRNDSFKDYPILLHESESPTHFRIFSPQMVNNRNILIEIRDAVNVKYFSPSHGKQNSPRSVFFHLDDIFQHHLKKLQGLLNNYKELYSLDFFNSTGEVNKKHLDYIP